ncbi:MAG: TIGR00730 family Rossman fold protein [Gammaproteobacteria bacterium]|nr:TIGR00730 family Rossman fold protein [Gammaproteobacteria bacterium]
MARKSPEDPGRAADVDIRRGACPQRNAVVTRSGSPLGRVCVFCGSNEGARSAYVEAAVELAGRLLARRIDLVYGGGRVGLMGRIADVVLAGGGVVHGVIPRDLFRREVVHDGLTELVVADSMLERKALMMDRSDAFVVLPGGYGTLDELFEALTWSQLGIHAKPVGVLDVAGYFDPLLAFLDHQVREGFVRAAHRQLLVVDTVADTLLDRLDAAAATFAQARS